MTHALVPVGPADLAECEATLAAGSKSFSAAGLLLPAALRPAITSLYAFCRVADDLVDEGDPVEGLAELRRRLDAIYAGRPEAHAVDCAFTWTVQRHGIPRAVLDLLVEGFIWDVEGRGYETLDDLMAYCVRVASTVGVMMTLIMGPRDPLTLARAADLGVAMQLTNIARDVGEDARNGRIYLPSRWLAEAGVDTASLGPTPTFSPALGEVVGRLLEVARPLYRRAETGIGRLPRRCRLAILAASRIYGAIGPVIVANGCDSVSTRAYTSRGRKIWLLFGALRAALWSPPLDPAPPLAAVVPLLDPISPRTPP